MDKATKRPTAADVARASGVSTATVSYVLNDTPGQSIPEATREKVARVARELGYTPNVHAQALARGTSNIAVIDLSEIPYGDRIARSARDIAAALASQGYLPIIDQPERSFDAPHTRLMALAARLAPRMVVTATRLEPAVQKRLRAFGVEHFITLFTHPDAIADRIEAAARTQVQYLHSIGHTLIGYCGTDEDQLSGLEEIRRSAVTDECATLGIAVAYVCSSRDISVVAEALSEARRASPAPTAIAAYNDEIAFTVLAAAHRIGVTVPHEMAVIGVDDIPLAAMAIPSLTTVTHVDDRPVHIGDLLALAENGVAVADPWPAEPRVVERDSA